MTLLLVSFVMAARWAFVFSFLRHHGGRDKNTHEFTCTGRAVYIAPGAFGTVRVVLRAHRLPTQKSPREPDTLLPDARRSVSQSGRHERTSRGDGEADGGGAGEAEGGGGRGGGGGGYMTIRHLIGPLRFCMGYVNALSRAW